MNKRLLATLSTLAIISLALYLFLNKQSKNGVDFFISQALETGAYHSITYDSVTLGVTGTTTISKIEIIDANDNEFKIGELVIAAIDLQHPTPLFMSISISDLGLPSFLNESNQASFTNPILNSYLQGIQDQNQMLPLSANFQYQYDEENSLLEASLNIAMAESGQASFSYAIKNIPLDVYFDNLGLSPLQLQQQYLPFLAVAEIPSVKMSISDFGFLDKVIELQADQRQSTKEIVFQQLASQVQNLSSLAPPSLQIQAQEISTHLLNFIEGQQSLSISISPEQGGNIQQLQPALITALFSGNYVPFIDMLNIEIISQ